MRAQESERQDIATSAGSTRNIRIGGHSKAFMFHPRVVVFIAALFIPRISHGQIRFVMPGEHAAIDTPTQAAVIDSVTDALNRGYVFEDKAAKMGEYVRSRLASGAYRGAVDLATFVRQLQKDLRSIYDDWHLEVVALHTPEPGEDKDIASPTQTQEYERRLRECNYGFEKIEILPGNIGYLKLTRFADVDVAGESAVAAMNLLASSYALIIDLRGNGGGNATMLQLIVGYFFDEPMQLTGWFTRGSDEIEQSWSPAFVPGRRITEQPVYLLVGKQTASAAEGFAYDLKNLGRAMLIGECTAGGAHIVRYHFFDFDGFRIGLKLPYGRAVSPVTHSNWEETGVVPHVEVPVEQALLTAQIKALETLLERETDEQAQNALRWKLQDVEAELHPVKLTKEELQRYVGTYGPRLVFARQGTLHYQRQGGPQYRLIPIGDDQFKLEGLDTFRVQFVRDGSGEVNGLLGLYDTGLKEMSRRAK